MYFILDIDFIQIVQLIKNNKSVVKNKKNNLIIVFINVHTLNS